MLNFAVTILLLVTFTYTSCTNTVETPLLPTDISRLEKVFEDGIQSNDLQTIFYSARHSKSLTKDEEAAACKKLLTAFSESKLNDFEKNYYLSGAHKSLKCTSALPSSVIDSIKNSLAKEIATSQELFFYLQSAKFINYVLDANTKQKLTKNLESILKKDDSLNSLGYGFHIAIDLGVSTTFAYDRIEDAIVQSDEIDGKMLQFEGGLGVTALILNGAISLSRYHKKPVPFSAEQSVKFTNYLLSRRSVQTAKGASILLESLETIMKDNDIAPIAITAAKNGKISPENQILGIHIQNLMGEPLSSSLTNVLVSISSKSGGSSLISKTALQSSATDKSLYTLNLSQFKASRGLYTVDLQSGKYTHKLNIAILGKIKVDLLEIGVGDSDSSQVKKQNVIYPSHLSEPLNADAQQKVVIKLNLVDESTNSPVTVHQAFVRLSNKQSDDEIFFVAEQDTSKSYKFDMDVGARGSYFEYKSGLYSIELIIGDAFMSNSFNWNLGDIQLKFSQEPVFNSKDNARALRPEIVHKFREPEKRPPRLISDLFSLLCIAPLLILLIIWSKLRVNISNFPFSLSALGFHLGFGAILALYGIFWLQLNMFDTIRYLIPLALFTFLCGNRLLRALASRKSESSEK